MPTNRNCPRNSLLCNLFTRNCRTLSQMHGAMVYSSQLELHGDVPLVFDTEAYDTDNIHDVVTTPSESFQTSRFIVPRGFCWAKMEARAVVRHTQFLENYIAFRKNWEDGPDIGYGDWKIAFPTRGATEPPSFPATFYLQTPWLAVKPGDVFDLWINDAGDTAGWVVGGHNGTWWAIELR